MNGVLRDARFTYAWQRWRGRPLTIRLLYLEQARPPAHGRDEPHPTLMRTPAASLRRARRLGQDLTIPGRSRYAGVPRLVATQKATGSPPFAGGARSARLPAGAERPAISSSWRAVIRRGSGGRGEDASASIPLTLGDEASASIPFASPDPPADRGPLLPPRSGSKAGAAGVPSKRQVTGATAANTSERTRSPVTSGCHRSGWPRRLPFGFGSPAAPWLNVAGSG
jgi:hypothetical protein